MPLVTAGPPGTTASWLSTRVHKLSKYLLYLLIFASRLNTIIILKTKTWLERQSHKHLTTPSSMLHHLSIPARKLSVSLKKKYGKPHRLSPLHFQRSKLLSFFLFKISSALMLHFIRSSAMFTFEPWRMCTRQQRTGTTEINTGGKI